MKLLAHLALLLWALSAASPQEPPERSAELRRGFDLVDQGKTRQAIKIFEAENRASGDNCLAKCKTQNITLEGGAKMEFKA